MKKEIMVIAESKAKALEKLSRAFAAHFDKHMIDEDQFKWIIKPEVKQRRPDQWRAYGRIEWRLRRPKNLPAKES